MTHRNFEESQQLREEYKKYVQEAAEMGVKPLSLPMFRNAMSGEFRKRLEMIVAAIGLAENFSVLIDWDRENTPGRFYFQIRCWRKDVITGEWGFGYGGKAYLSPHASDSELVQTIFGLYKGYWEHEARESFTYHDRRVFGPHISTDALWTIARHVDVRSVKHVEDRPDTAEENAGRG